MTITLTRKEAQQVLDALEDIRYADISDSQRKAIETLCVRLDKPEPKPACWLYKGEVRLSPSDLPPTETIALYTAPPQRERVKFPTMLRKMWSGTEVQAWLDENVNKEAE
jgi:hypothetical protein